MSRSPSLLYAVCRRCVAVLLAVGVAAGCGFQLRTSQALPYDSMYLAVPDHSEFGINLKRAIRATGSTRLVDAPGEAQAIFTPTAEASEKHVLSFNSAGRVREFQLRYRYAYRVHDATGRDLVEPVNIAMTRDYSFDDASVLAKQQEEALLWQDMKNDLVRQVLRRLAASKPQFAGAGAAAPGNASGK